MEKLSPIGWAIRPLKNYAKFSGRASRAEFWWFFLFVMVAYAGALFALGASLATFIRSAPAQSLSMNGGVGLAFGFIGLFWTGLFIPMLAVQVRRLHDTNRSGWWLGAFWLLYPIYMMLLVGTTVTRGAAGPTQGAGIAIAAAIFALAMFCLSIVLLVFFCLRGTEGPNRFGDDPYGESVAEVFA